MISAVIVTYNCEKMLEDCLKSITTAGEIVVVDLGSKDKTLQIAKRFKSKIFTHPQVDYVEMIRDFAVAKATGDWILVLDPDERLTPTLWNQLEKIVSQNQYAAVNIPRKNIFFGKWISHTNWWPDKQIRFFRKGTVSWGNQIHSYPKIQGKVLELAQNSNITLIHYGYTNFNEFILRQNRYSDIEAKNLFDRGIKFSWFTFFWKPVREFLTRYIRHAGFLDGFYGFALTYFMMIYQLEVQIKLWDLEQQK